MSYNYDMDRQNLDALRGARLGIIGDRHIVQDKYGNRYVKEEAVNDIIYTINEMLFDLERGTSISYHLDKINRTIL